jgi:hypothetical protein
VQKISLRASLPQDCRMGDQPVNAYVRPALRHGNCGLLSRSCSLSNDGAAGRAICTIQFWPHCAFIRGQQHAGKSRSISGLNAESA